MTHAFGFEMECLWKYDRDIYNRFIDLFCHMPLCVVVHRPIGDFFLCHGGISPKLHYINQVNRIDRFREPPEEGLFCDLLWSDPLQYDFYDEKYEQGLTDEDWFDATFMDNEIRDCSYFYGCKSVLNFLRDNNLKGIVRGHECVDGVVQYDYEYEDGSPRVFTVFSSAGYDGPNRAGVLLIGADGMKIARYNSVPTILKKPILTDAFILSVPSLLDLLQTCYDQLMIMMFSVCDDDLEDETEKETESQTSENPSVDPLEHMTDYADMTKATCEDCLFNTRPVDPLQRPVITVNSNIPEQPKKIVTPVRASQLSAQCDSILTAASMPTTQLFGSVNSNDNMFRSLTGPEKKKQGFFTYRFNKRNESIPLSISQLREEWNRSFKDSSTQSSTRTSLSTSLSSSTSSLCKQFFTDETGSNFF